MKGNVGSNGGAAAMSSVGRGKFVEAPLLSCGVRPC